MHPRLLLTHVFLFSFGFGGVLYKDGPIEYALMAGGFLLLVSLAFAPYSEYYDNRRDKN